MMEVGPNVEVARRFYGAMHALDVRALLRTLAEDFTGTVTAGLPQGFGGVYEGRRRMLEECWMPVHQVFGALPLPHQFLEAPPDHVVVVGEYRGCPPSTGRRFAAAFCHVFRLADGLIVELRQVTDSAMWATALEPAVPRASRPAATDMVVFIN